MCWLLGCWGIFCCECRPTIGHKDVDASPSKLLSTTSSVSNRLTSRGSRSSRRAAAHLSHRSRGSGAAGCRQGERDPSGSVLGKNRTAQPGIRYKYLQGKVGAILEGGKILVWALGMTGSIPLPVPPAKSSRWDTIAQNMAIMWHGEG